LLDFLNWILTHNNQFSAAKSLVSLVKDLILGLTAIVGVVSVVAAARSAKAASEQALIANDAKITDRIAKAVEFLGNEKENIRIGAILSLERIAKDSPRDHQVIFEQISVFIKNKLENKPRHSDEIIGIIIKNKSYFRDVNLAIEVIGRRNFKNDSLQIDLSNCNFSNIRMQNKNFRGINFFGSTFNNSSFFKCNFEECNLITSDFSDCTFNESILSGSKFQNSTLSRAKIVSCDMKRCIFIRAKVDDLNIKLTDMSKSTFSRNRFINAEISDSKFGECKISYVEFKNTKIKKSLFIYNIWENVDLSHATARNLTIIKCKIKKVISPHLSCIVVHSLNPV